MRWAKFHPLGLRGVNGTGVDGRYGTVPLAEYMQRANAETFIAIQIEHIDAAREVEAIAAIPGVDVLFVGPADLGQSMGIVGQWDHPDMWQAIERVARAGPRVQHRVGDPAAQRGVRAALRRIGVPDAFDRHRHVGASARADGVSGGVFPACGLAVAVRSR